MVLFSTPIAISAAAFAGANLAVSTHCWYSTGRKVMLASGLVNSSLACAGVWYSDEAPLLTHGYAGLSSVMASLHYFVHFCRIPQLQEPMLRNYVFLAWIGSLAVFGVKELRWTYSLSDV